LETEGGSGSSSTVKERRAGKEGMCCCLEGNQSEEGNQEEILRKNGERNLFEAEWRNQGVRKTVRGEGHTQDHKSILSSTLKVRHIVGAHKKVS